MKGFSPGACELPGRCAGEFAESRYGPLEKSGLESWLNSAASALAPRNPRNGSPYIHVEILFVPKNGQLRNKAEVYGDACSIVYSGTVHMQKKRFSRKEWAIRS